MGDRRGVGTNFATHNSGASYRELREALTQNQHGLCGLLRDCDLRGWLDRQIEHVIPRRAISMQLEHQAKALDISQHGRLLYGWNIIRVCFL